MNVWFISSFCNQYITCLQLAKNPMTTEGAKAVVRAITGAEGMRLKYLNIEVRVALYQYPFYFEFKLPFKSNVTKSISFVCVCVLSFIIFRVNCFLLFFVFILIDLNRRNLYTYMVYDWTICYPSCFKYAYRYSMITTVSQCKICNWSLTKLGLEDLKKTTNFITAAGLVV